MISNMTNLGSKWKLYIAKDTCVLATVFRGVNNSEIYHPL